MKNIEIKKQALAKYTGENSVEYNADFDEYTLPDGRTYKIFTGAEADRAAADEIKNSLWAFNADFILAHSRALDDLSDRECEQVKKSLQEMQANLCESATPLVRCLIADLDDLVADAIDADGRGHFIAQYDGDEIDLGDDLYAYRID